MVVLLKCVCFAGCSEPVNFGPNSCNDIGLIVAVVPPSNSMALPSTLGREGDEDKNPQRKDYRNTAECTKYPWLHYQGWDHYKTTLGRPPFPTVMCIVSVNIQNNPNPRSDAPKMVP